MHIENKQALICAGFAEAHGLSVVSLSAHCRLKAGESHELWVAQGGVLSMSKRTLVTGATLEIRRAPRCC